MKEELARLKEEQPDLKHPDRSATINNLVYSPRLICLPVFPRFKIAATNWAKAKENPKNAK